jgi:hypothetical protein
MLKALAQRKTAKTKHAKAQSGEFGLGENWFLCGARLWLNLGKSRI